MAAINQLSKDFTIVMIAHRLSTVERCDRVIRLQVVLYQPTVILVMFCRLKPE